ncbi:MAG: FHA domain-containing protein [Bdellovibrionales bacterium]|nr:FHA domain-containing protein [Bdellovibrionales bacterium]
MALTVSLVLNGKPQDAFRLRSGTRFGRQGAEIIVKDPRVSSIHAIVEQDMSGRMFLVDAGSSNGIKVKGKSETKIRLIPGTKFTLGSTEFLIRDESSTISPEFSQLALTLEKLASTAFIGKGTGTIAFQNAVIIEVVQGASLGNSVEFGFGPRYVGTDSLDFSFLEFGPKGEALQLGFTVLPEGNAIRYSTTTPNKVKLNGRPISSEILKGGEKVSIGETQLLIRF